MADGSLIQRIEIPAGTVDSVFAKKSHHELFYRVATFLAPGTIYRVDLKKLPHKPEIIKEIAISGFDASQFDMKQVFYSSYDGTIVPMFIVHNKNLVRNSNASTLLYGYGGFGVDILPSFSPNKIVFVQNMDGIYAIPNIRGGG